MSGLARKTTKTLNFEEGLNRLEAIADAMEKGELPLDELLKLYEEGVKLSADLTAKLDAAEGRMMEVRQGQGGVTTEPLTMQENLLDALNENGGQ